MVLKKSFIFVIICAVILQIAKLSNGSQEAIQEMVQKFESRISNNDYRIRHKAAFDTIDTINNEANAANRRVRNSNEKTAINQARIGYINSVKCIAVAGDEAYNANQEVQELFNSETAKQKVMSGNVAAKQGVLIADVASYRMLGAATRSAGNYATQPLKESIKYVILAGQAAKSGLDELKELAIIGIESGGPAKNQSLKASTEAIEATGSVFYNNLLISAKIAFGGIDRSRPAAPEDLSSGTNAANNSQEALAEIELVKNLAESTKSSIGQGSSRNAVDVVRDGVISAIKGTAAAIQKPQEVLKSANEANGQDISKQLIEKVIKDGKNDIAYAASNALQSIIIAGNMVGNDGILDDLERAVSAVEDGISAAFKSLETALFFALNGLENGGTTKQTGLTVAVDSVLTSAFAAYTRFVAAANNAFNVLKS